MSNILDIIEDTFEDELGPNLIANIPKVPAKQLKRFRDRYAAFARSYQLPPKEDFELRPFITGGALGVATGTSAIPLHSSDFATADLVEAQEDIIKHHLLYCHSLVITDPLPEILFLSAFNDHYREWTSKPDHKAKPFGKRASRLGRLTRFEHIRISAEDRLRIQNYFTFLSYIKPLIEANVVCMVEPRYWRNVEGVFHPDVDYRSIEVYKETYMAQFEGLREIRKLLVEDEASALLFSALSSIKELPGDEEYPGGYEVLSTPDEVMAFTGIADTVAGSVIHKQSLDMYFPDEIFVTVLKRTLGDMSKELHARRRELMLLNQLLTIKLPRLANITPQDLVNIREGGEIFASWRNGLSRALERISNLDEELTDPEGEKLAIINEELSEQRRNLQDGIKKSGFLASVQKGFTNLTIGGVAAAITCLTVGPTAGIITGLTTAATKSAFETILDRIKARGEAKKHTLLQHYLLFTPDYVQPKSRKFTPIKD